MQLYKVTITPTSHFTTTLKGDTIFGQVCWAIFYKFGKERLSKLLNSYREGKKPFLIASDAFPKGYLPKPTMPSTLLNEKSEDKKKNRKKIWLKLDELQKGKYKNAKTDKDINNEDSSDITIHNSLNYKTFHTGDGFDPYGLKVWKLLSQDIYFLIDQNQFTINEFKEAFELLSKMGYGKKITIGYGRFKIDSTEQIDIDNYSQKFMTLSPFSPKGLNVKSIYYNPFTRFGKFGASRAYKNAFKKPILLADTSSVIEFENKQRYQYLGRVIDGVSDIYRDTVHQGYSIVIPIGDAK